MVDNENCIQLAIYADIHCDWIACKSVGLTEHILKCLKMVQVSSGRQLTICTPPPASDAGLERQARAATAMTSLFQSFGGF